MSKVYIGQSIDIESRVNAHRYMLSKNTHYNFKLQEHYNIHKSIEYTVLSICSIEELDSLEIQWISEFNSIDSGLNINSGGPSGGRGTSNSNSKYSKDIIIECFHYLLDYKNSPKNIANILHMSESSVSHISNGRQHTWLKDLFPEKYTLLMNIHNKNLRGSYQARSSTKEYPPLINPNGQIFYIEHLSNFCKEHKLHSGAICRVLKGNLGSYIGWKLA
jgi:hypothetical protein